MSNGENNFLSVLGRLKTALDCTDDLQVAEKLAMSRTAFGNRKLRGSLPTEHIDALLKKEGLNPEYIYKGTGPVHLDIDVESWEAGFRKRLAQLLGGGNFSDVLVSQGHAAKGLVSVASGELEPAPRLLRDIQKHLSVDLNWLVSGDTSTQLSKDEDALLTQYRKATKEGQTFIAQAAGMAQTRREALARDADAVMDVATGKHRPGGETATDEKGISVRVPKPRSSTPGVNINTLHGQQITGNVKNTAPLYFGVTPPAKSKKPGKAK